MIGNTGDTQPLKVPGLPLCMCFRGKPDDLKIITQQVDQAAERHLSDGNVATENFTAGPDQTDLSEGSALPAKALPAKLAFQPAEERADASAAAATPDGALIQAPENQSEENMFVIRPRPAERRAEDFMRDWMRRFTRS